MDSFYITLPSNVKSSDSFENRIGNYYTKLAKRLNLEGKWEVGIKEISYTRSWWNIKYAQHAYLYEPTNGQLFTTELLIPAGDYSDIKVIINEVNKNLEYYLTHEKKRIKLHSAPFVEYSETSKSVEVSHGMLNQTQVIYVFLTQEVAALLGLHDMVEMYDMMEEVFFSPVMTIEKKQKIRHALERMKLKGQVDLDAGRHSLYIYCDIAEPSFVGDSLTKLLRVVQIPSSLKFGEQAVIIYENPIFLPLSRTEFDSIEIDIKDDTGETMPFQFGRSIVTLQFRRVK